MKKFTLFMVFLAACDAGGSAGGTDAGWGSADAALAGDSAGDAAATSNAGAYACQTNTCNGSVTCGCVVGAYTPPADTTCTTATVTACDDGDPCTADSCGFNGCAHTAVCQP